MMTFGRFSWQWELISLFIMVSTQAILVAALANFHHKALDDLPSGITYTAIIAILSTTSRIAMGHVLTSCIAQARWNWLAKSERSLKDFRRHSDGVDGGWGSIALIWHSLWNLREVDVLVTIFASISLLLSLGVSTFSQQTAAAGFCKVDNVTGAAARPVTNMMPNTDLVFFDPEANSFIEEIIQNVEYDEVDGQTRAAMMGFLATVGSSSDKGRIPRSRCEASDDYLCSRGSYKPMVSYSTVGLCNRCFNTSELIERVPVTSKDAQGSRFVLKDDSGTVRLEVSNTTGSTEVRGTEPRIQVGILNSLDLEDFPSWSHESIEDEGDITEWPNFFDVPDEDMPRPWIKPPSEYESQVTLLAFKSDGNDTLCGATTNCTEIPGNVYAMTCSLYPCRADMDFNTMIVNEAPLQQKHRLNATNHYNKEFELITAPKSICSVNDAAYSSDMFEMIPRNEKHWKYRPPLDFTLKGYDDPISVPPDCYYAMVEPYARALKTFLTSSLFNDTCSGTKDIDYPFCHIHRNPSRSAPFDKTISEFSRQVTDYFAAYVGLSTTIESIGLCSPWEMPCHTSDGKVGIPQYQVYDEAYGMAIDYERPCVIVYWPWISYSVALSLITAGVLWRVMRQSHQAAHRAPVWKSSILPLLLYDFRLVGERQRGQPYGNLEELEVAAKDIQVSLQMSHPYEVSEDGVSRVYTSRTCLAAGAGGDYDLRNMQSKGDPK